MLFFSTELKDFKRCRSEPVVAILHRPVGLAFICGEFTIASKSVWIDQIIRWKTWSVEVTKNICNKVRKLRKWLGHSDNTHSTWDNIKLTCRTLAIRVDTNISYTPSISLCERESNLVLYNEFTIILIGIKCTRHITIELTTHNRMKHSNFSSIFCDRKCIHRNRRHLLVQSKRLYWKPKMPNKPIH